MGQFRLFLSTTINRWMRHCLQWSKAAPSFVSVEISWTRLCRNQNFTEHSC